MSGQNYLEKLSHVVKVIAAQIKIPRKSLSVLMVTGVTHKIVKFGFTWYYLKKLNHLPDSISQFSFNELYNLKSTEFFKIPK